MANPITPLQQDTQSHNTLHPYPSPELVRLQPENDRLRQLEALLQAEQDRVIELKKANEALKRSLNLLAHEPVLEKLLGCVLRAMVDQLGKSSGGIYLYNDVPQTTILHLNYEDGQLQYGEQISHPGATLPNPLTAWDDQYLPLLRQNQILIHQETDFASPAYAPYRDYHAQLGIKTLLFVPMLFGDMFLGTIALRTRQPHPCKPEELELIRALAHQATLAIQLTRLVDGAKQAAVLEERNRIARDVHDTLAQAFTGVIMQLEATKRKISTAQPEVAQTHITRARSLAQAGLSEARRSVRALRPEFLESNDLPDALHHLATQMTFDTSAHILVDISGTPYPLSVEIETNLLRIAQEAVTNALRHADPQTVQVQLHFTEQRVELSVIDDGQGFEPQTQFEVRFGLIGMQERAQRMKGEFVLTSTMGQGTEILISVPR